VNFHNPRAGPVLATLAAVFLSSAGSMPAQSEPTTIGRCSPSIVSFEGSVGENFQRDLEKIGDDLAKRNSDIDRTATAIGAAPNPTSGSEQVRAFGSRLEALSRAAHALEEQINTVTRTTTPCNSNPKELSHE
jgi:hypothetical protein